MPVLNAARQASPRDRGRAVQVATVEAPQQTETVQSFNDICTRRTQSRRQRRSSFGQEDSDVRSCYQRCQAQGGEPSGQRYTDFQCVTQERPTAVCARVQPAGDGWQEADGTLPDMPGGASGAGVARLRTNMLVDGGLDCCGWPQMHVLGNGADYDSAHGD